MVFNIILSLVITLNAFLGLLVLAKNYKNHINISFFTFIFSLICWTLINYFSNQATGFSHALFLNKLIFYVTPYIAFSLLYFSLVFPRYIFQKNLTVMLLFSLSLVLISNILTAANLTITNITFLPNGGTGVVFGPGIIFYSLLMVSFMIASTTILIKKFLQSKGYDRSQLQYLLFGIIIMMIIATITNLAIPILFNRFEVSNYGPFSSIAVIGFTSYAILRHRLLDIRLVVARTVAYTLLLTILSVIYTGAIFVISISWLGAQVPKTQIIINAALALFIAITTQPLKNLLEKITFRVFYKGTYNTADLISQLTNIMASSIQLEVVTKKTLHELLNTIHIRGGMFIIFDKDRLYPAIAENYEDKKYDVDTVKKLGEHKRVVILQEENNEEIKQIMRELDAAIALPLFISKEIHGILLLKDKKSGDMYSDQDIKVLEIFGPSISVAVENAKSYEEIRRFNITLRDEVEKATKDLKAANDRLKELDKLKDEFVSLASHELRTPMTIIKNYLWMLGNDTKKPLKGKQKEYIDQAYASTNRLINLVNDMLNVSRIESGRFTLNPAKIQVADLAEETVAEILPRAKELGINLSVKQNGTIPLVNADPERIKQVLINLIGNSLKFTPEKGSITLSFENDTNSAIIHVTDTGKGIRKEDLPKLFQKFSIVGNEYLRKLNSQGTGLGLYLSKAIVTLHKGKIWVKSDGEDKGATFSFSLPYAEKN